MNLRRFLPLTLIFFGLTTRLALAQGTFQSDYQFQLDLYRRNYAQYQLFLKDYQDNRSLANEQRAIGAAREALIPRELALANFYWLLADGIKKTNVDYPVVNQAVGDLTAIGQYHYEQSAAAAKIDTSAALTTFTKESRQKINDYQVKIIRAQVAAKLARLIQFQLDIKRAYDAVLPQFTAQKDNLAVQNGISQIESYSSQANDLTLDLAEKIAALDLEEQRAEQFYEDSTETLTQIRSLEQRLIDLIIELDTAYVQR